MSTLTNEIEKYLKTLLVIENNIEVKRNEIAKRFTCVPSQINYVLKTRFTEIQGYEVRSYRGGGGYIRITKLSVKDPQNLLKQILEEKEYYSSSYFESFLRGLKEGEYLTDSEFSLLEGMINSREWDKQINADEIKRIIMKQALLFIMKGKKNGM